MSPCICGQCDKEMQQIREKTVTLPHTVVTMGGVPFLLRGIHISLARVDGNACHGEPPFMCIQCCEAELKRRLHARERPYLSA